MFIGHTIPRWTNLRPKTTPLNGSFLFFYQLFGAPNGGFLKLGYPQSSSISIGISIFFKHPALWGTSMTMETTSNCLPSHHSWETPGTPGETILGRLRSTLDSPRAAGGELGPAGGGDEAPPLLEIGRPGDCKISCRLQYEKDRRIEDDHWVWYCQICQDGNAFTNRTVT